MMIKAVFVNTGSCRNKYFWMNWHRESMGVSGKNKFKQLIFVEVICRSDCLLQAFDCHKGKPFEDVNYVI